MTAALGVDSYSNSIPYILQGGESLQFYLSAHLFSEDTVAGDYAHFWSSPLDATTEV